MRTALLWWAVTRPTVLLIGFVSLLLLGHAQVDAFQPGGPARHPWADLPARWDALFYREIATHGYSWNGSNEVGQTVAFFPAFPLAMRGAAAVSRLPMLWAGTVVSLAAFLLALVYLHRLTRELTDETTAWGTVGLLAAYPSAVFFSAPYTESLFLLACTGAFWHARRREHAAAGAWGLLAGLCRVPGFLLAAPLAWIAWRHAGPAAIAPRGRALAALAAAAPVLGIVLYSAYLGKLTGHPLLWIENQSGWGRPYYQELMRGAVVDPTPGGPRDYSGILLDSWNYAAVALVAGTLPFALRWLGFEYGLFLVLMIVPGLLGHGFTSLGRFTAVVFPSFIVLARALRTRPRIGAVAAVFFLGQAFGAAMFFSWRHWF